jgi:apolipoprotein N-acyltransferase
MHCEQSRLRAIENRLPVVRSANTGISALINDKGEVIDSLPPLVEGYSVSEIAISDNSYVSRLLGTLPLYLCSFILLASIGYGIYDKKRR